MATGMTLRNWLPRVGNRRRSAASSERERGDQARSRGDWGAAADHYRRHLDRTPADGPIWIQLGHMLKEAGRFDEALEAYRAAQAICADDSDLLLSFGHLHKVRGEIEEAIRFYGESARLDGNAGAKDELGRLSLSHPLVSRQGTLPLTGREESLRKAVASLTTGLSPTAVNGLTHIGGDRFAGANDDPWIEFELDPPLSERHRAAALTIDFTPGTPGSSLNGQLYVDYGLGFDERHSIRLDGSRTPERVLLACPGLITRLRWDPDTAPSAFALRSITLQAFADQDAAAAAIAPFEPEESEAEAAFDTIARLYAAPKVDPTLAATLQERLPPRFDAGFYYEYWREKFIEPRAEDYSIIRRMTDAMPLKPSFSFVVPVYNTPVDLLRECVDAMLAQTYPHFEICLSDDNSPNPDVKNLLREYASNHANVKVRYRRHNGHISANSNSALELASGDYIVLVDHDDLLPDYALFVVADAINRNPDAQIFYSDEDKISLAHVRHSPYFKGDFNRFLMYGHNMVSHLGVYRRSLVNSVGGFRKELEGSQDYDLLLRCLEKIGDNQIVHIPHVLYHWRTIPGSTSVSHDQKDYAIVAARAAINGHFERTGLPLRSGEGFAPGVSGVRSAAESSTRVSIVIPTRDRLEDLRPCLSSILKLAPENVEILIVDNGSVEQQTRDFLARAAQDARIRVLAHDAPFNFSAINNAAAEQATGDILCFLNNDTEVQSAAWLDRARMLLAMDDVGMVGARLLYPDGSIQHFGIGLGMADHKVAGSPHLGLPAALPGYFGKARLIQEVSAVTAACMFVRRADFLRLGGFDPELRVAYNDVDLCIRFREAGLRIVCDPEIQLVHKESRSRGSDMSGDNRARLDAEAALMRQRWGDILDHDPFLSPNHDLNRPDFALAYPPRVPMPWRRSAGADSVQ